MSTLSRPIPRLSTHLSRLASRTPSTQAKRLFRTLPRQMSDMTTIISKNAAAPVGPYSHAIRTSHAIYCSGQLPADARGNLVEGTMGEKTGACLKALSAILDEAGSSLDKIVKVQIFLTDMKNFAEMNKEYERWIKHRPARSCVAVKQLPKDVDVEIECVALPSKRRMFGL